jgi:hypothetical protein
MLGSYFCLGFLQVEELLTLTPTVTEADICHVIAAVSGVPVNKVSASESNSLSGAPRAPQKQIWAHYGRRHFPRSFHPFKR